MRPRPYFQTPAIPIERLLYAAHKLSSPHLLAPQWQQSHPSQSRSYLKAQGHPWLEEGGQGIIVHEFSVSFAIFGSLGLPRMSALSPCPSPLHPPLHTITLGSAPRPFRRLFCVPLPNLFSTRPPLPSAAFGCSPEFMSSSPLSSALSSAPTSNPLNSNPLTPRVPPPPYAFGCLPKGFPASVHSLALDFPAPPSLPCPPQPSLTVPFSALQTLHLTFYSPTPSQAPPSLPYPCHSPFFLLFPLSASPTPPQESLLLTSWCPPLPLPLHPAPFPLCSIH